MAGNFGLWIDHQKAYLVEQNGKGEVRRLESGIEPSTRERGKGRRGQAGAGVEADAESKIENRRANQLKAWYRDIIETLSKSGIDRVFLMGPGEAKNELLNEMNKNRTLADKVVGTRAAEQLTENQLAAAVREFYNPDAANHVPDYRRPPGT